MSPQPFSGLPEDLSHPSAGVLHPASEPTVTNLFAPLSERVITSVPAPGLALEPVTTSAPAVVPGRASSMVPSPSIAPALSTMPSGRPDTSSLRFTNDVIFKRVFSYPRVLCGLLNGLLGYEGDERVVDVAIAPTELHEGNHATRRVLLDLRWTRSTKSDPLWSIRFDPPWQ